MTNHISSQVSYPAVGKSAVVLSLLISKLCIPVSCIMVKTLVPISTACTQTNEHSQITSIPLCREFGTQLFGLL